MCAVLRRAVFWLVMLAIPVHGIAFTVMPLHALDGHAGSMQQASTAEMASDMDTGGAALHASKDCAGKVGGCDLMQHAGMDKCGSSAACSFVAAPAPQASARLQPPSYEAPVTARPSPRIAFCTGAPERPPRSLA